MSTTAITERTSKRFCAIDDFHNVVEVTGYECPPSDEYWWVPELGYTLTVGHHLFDAEDDARAMAIKKLESAIADLQRALDRLCKEPK